MRFRLPLVALALAVAAMSAMTVALAAKPAHPTIVRFSLSGPAINDVTPRGHAVYQAGPHNGRLLVGVRRVSMPEGTEMHVFVDGVDVGTFTLNESGAGHLLLRTSKGESVPTVTKTSVIQVTDGTSVILDNS